jgi:hypothetical protein
VSAFNRAEHCRTIAAHGGTVTAQRYGAGHMRAIGKAGAQVTIQRHGVSYFNGLMTRRGWSGRRIDSVIDDLAAGRVYAELSA